MRIENPAVFWANPAPRSVSVSGKNDDDAPWLSYRASPMEENMAWTRDCCIGIPEIDRQHRILFDCVLLLEDCLASGTTRSTIQSVLGQLVDFARLHFACEERSMRDHQYPGLEKHLQFMGNLRDLQQRLRRGAVSNAAIFFIENRLLEHILTSVSEYGSWLAEAGKRGEGDKVPKASN
jgi:hemerythrin